MLLPFPAGQLSLALGGRWVLMLLGVFKALIHVCVCVCVCVCVLYLHVCPPFQTNKERRLGDPREMHRMKTFKCTETGMRFS